MEQDFFLGKMCFPLQNKYHLRPDVCKMMYVLHFQLTLLCSVVGEDTNVDAEKGQKTPVLPHGVERKQSACNTKK